MSSKKKTAKKTVDKKTIKKAVKKLISKVEEEPEVTITGVKHDDEKVVVMYSNGTERIFGIVHYGNKKTIAEIR